MDHSNAVVGRIIPLECHQVLPAPPCARCAELERGIREYLDGYTSRNVNQEGWALRRLGELVGR